MSNNFIRKLAILPVFILFLAIFSLSASAAITACGDIGASDSLTQDIFANGTCLSVTANDISIDCQGFSLFGNGTGLGINISGRTNVTINNCNIDSFNFSISAINSNLIFVYDTNSSNASQTAFNASNIFNSQLINFSSYQYQNTFTAVSSRNGNNLTFENILINGTNTSGIFNNNISNSSFRNTNIYSASMGDTFSTENNFTNILIENGGFGFGTGSSLNKIENIYISGTGLSFNFADNNDIYNSTINSSSIGINFEASSSNRLNKTILSTQNTWIYTLTGSVNNITDTEFKNSFGSVKYFQTLETPGDEDNFTITNLNISSNFTRVKSSLLSFLNTTAQITLNNVPPTNPKPIVDFNDNGTFVACSSPQCTIINSSNLTFVFNVSSFTSYSTQDSIACGSNLTTSTTLTENLTCPGTALYIGANNVELDCNGYTIEYGQNGSNSQPGISASSVSNLIIRNCFIRDINASGSDGYGISFEDVNSTLIINNSITTNGTSVSRGISFTGSAIQNDRNHTVTSNIIRAVGTSGANDGIRVIRGRELNFSNNNFTTNSSAIYINTIAANVTINDNSIIANEEGYSFTNVAVFVGSTTNATVYRNNISAKGVGTAFNGCTDCIAENNTITAILNSFGFEGINVQDSTRSKLISNRINASSSGITYTGGSGGGNHLADSNIINASSGVEYGGAQANSNFTNNNLTITNGFGISYNSASGGLYSNNNIIIMTPPSGGPFFGVDIGNANNTVINNLNLTILGNTDWMRTTLSGRTTNFTNTTLRNSSGSVFFPNTFQLENTTTISKEYLNISNNFVRLNSSALPFLNTSAQITLNNVNTSIPIVDFEDDGTYQLCTPPQCVVQSFSGGILTFNVSSFTTYSSSDGGANVTISKTDSPDPLNLNTTTLLTYQINFTVNSGSAFNITINETYPANTTFINSTPAPSVGNNSWNVGNLTATQRYQINITINVSNLLPKGTNLTNSIYVVYENGSGSTFNASIQENTTITKDNDLPIVHNVTLLATSQFNTTDDNLTVYFNITDADGDATTNITDWRINSSSIAFLNYPFESGSSNSSFSKDYSTNQNNGTVSGAIFNSSGGINGFGAYQFDGSGDFVDSSSTVNFTDKSFSIVAWIKRNVNSAEQYYAGAGSAGTRTGLHVGYRASNVFTFAFYDDDLNTGATYSDAGSWIHWSVTYDAVTRARRIYRNGTLVASDTTGGNLSANSAFTIGRTFLSSRDFNGTIDGITLYNRSLSANEVLALFNNQTNLIVSNETSVGNVWQACVTPNDKTQDGTTVCSNNLTIQEAPGQTSVSLTKTDSPDPLNLSNTTILTYQINFTVTNGTAYNVAINETYPANTTFINSTPAPTSGDNFWNAGNITTGTTYQINITVNVSNLLSRGINLTNTVNASYENISGTNFNVSVQINTTITANNNLPIIHNVTLTATTSDNTTNDNLTVTFNVTDVDGDATTNITNWLLNDTSVMVLNLAFEGGSNLTHSRDYSNFSNNITASAGGPVFLPSGNALGFGAYEFDGVTDVLTAPHNNSLNLVDGIPMSWETYIFYNSSCSDNFPVIVAKSNAGTTSNYQLGMTKATGVFDITWFNGGFIGHGSTISVPSGVWTHLAVVYNGSHLFNYINGTFDNVVAQGPPPITNTELLRVGNRDSDNDFCGKIDYVRIWNRSLTANQIAALYNYQTNLLVSNETSVGNVWQSCVTPNDKTQDGNTSCSNTITINPAVAVCPGIITVSTYITENISVATSSSCVQIGASNIILDCQGYTLRGNGSGLGINLTSQSNVTIRNCDVINFSTNLQLINASNNSILNSNFSNSSGVNVVVTTSPVFNNTFSNILILHSSIFNALSLVNSTFSSFNNITITSSNGANPTMSISANSANNTFNNIFISTDAASAISAIGSDNNFSNINLNSTNTGLDLSTASRNTFNGGQIKTSSGNLIKTGAGQNNTFSNLILTTSTGFWIETSTGANNNASNITFNNTNGSIRFIPNFVIQNTTNITQTLVNISPNRAFVNSTALSSLNISAQISLNNLNSSALLVDFEDDGIYVVCNPPQCVLQSFSSGTAVFNVSSFTSYSTASFADVDITITKSDSPDPINLNTTTLLDYQFSFIVTNGTAFNINITETYPDNVTFVNSTPAPTSGNNFWNAGNITAPGTYSINITVNVSTTIPNGTSITNTIETMYENSTGSGFNLSVSEATLVINEVVGQTNATLTKTGSPDPLNISNSTLLTYQINFTVTNETAYNTTIIETYSNNVTFINATPAPTSGNNTWSVGNITAPNMYQINITVNVSNSLANGSVVANTVNATYENATGSSFNIDATTVTTIIVDAAQANATAVTLTKTDSSDPLNISSTTLLTYQINFTVINGTAFNTTINETYPNNTTFINSTPAPTSGNNFWSAGNITTGTTYQINITLNVSNTLPNGTILTNTVNTTYQNATNATLTTNVQENTTITKNLEFNATAITLTKIDAPDPVIAGQDLTYTITINVTNGTAHNITLNDIYPAQVGFVTSTPAPDVSNNTWNVGNLTIGESFQVNITVNVASGTANGTTINNTANISYANSTGSILSLNVTAQTLVSTQSFPIVINNNTNITTNGTTTGPGIIINSSNVTVNCNGNVITGSGINIGVNNTGFDNVTLLNCVFVNFETGAYFENSNINNYINDSFVTVNNGIKLLGASQNSAFNNTIITASSDWVFTSAASSGNVFQNTSYNDTGGQIIIIPAVTYAANTNASQSRIDVTSPEAFVNSTALPFLDVASRVTINGITNASSALILGDFDDDGIYQICDAPFCSLISFTSGTAIFDTSGWTSYTVVDGGVNFTISKTSSPNPVTPGGQLIYTITATVNSGFAQNITVVESPPAELTFVTSTPTNISDNTWLLNNLSAGQSAQINVTYNVSANFTGSLQNNVSVTFQNSTNDTISTNVSQNTTVQPTPTPSGGGGGGGGGSSAGICPPFCRYPENANLPVCRNNCPPAQSPAQQDFGSMFPVSDVVPPVVESPKETVEEVKEETTAKVVEESKPIKGKFFPWWYILLAIIAIVFMIWETHHIVSKVHKPSKEQSKLDKIDRDIARMKKMLKKK